MNKFSYFDGFWRIYCQKLFFSYFRPPGIIYLKLALKDNSAPRGIISPVVKCPRLRCFRPPRNYLFGIFTAWFCLTTDTFELFQGSDVGVIEERMQYFHLTYHNTHSDYSWSKISVLSQSKNFEKDNSAPPRNYLIDNSGGRRKSTGLP